MQLTAEFYMSVVNPIVFSEIYSQIRVHKITSTTAIVDNDTHLVRNNVLDLHGGEKINCKKN